MAVHVVTRWTTNSPHRPRWRLPPVAPSRACSRSSVCGRVCRHRFRQRMRCVHILDLDDDGLTNIFRWLSVPSVVRVARVCRRFNELASDDYFWQYLYNRDLAGGDVPAGDLEQPPPPSGWKLFYKEMSECPRFGIICCPDVTVSEDGRLATRTEDPSCHAVLSSKPLRGRVRFDIEIVRMHQYFQIGVCTRNIDFQQAVIGTDETWVIYMTSNGIGCAYDNGVKKECQGKPPLLHERFGFAYDENAHALACYRHGTELLCSWHAVPSGVHACVLLGGTDTAMRLHPPSAPYPFQPAVKH